MNYLFNIILLFSYFNQQHPFFLFDEIIALINGFNGVYICIKNPKNSLLAYFIEAFSKILSIYFAHC